VTAAQGRALGRWSIGVAVALAAAILLVLARRRRRNVLPGMLEPQSGN
jgi:hypothetical protein